MRASGLSSELEQALSAYAHAAAQLLHADIQAGAEVELELGAQRGSRAHTAFYSYRPLTARFIAQRALQLERLPAHAHALAALARFDGLDRYLAGRSPGTGSRAHTALVLLLGDVFAEQTDFELRPERLAAALTRLERAEQTDAPDTLTLVATLHGLTIGSPAIQLTPGLTIATRQALRWAPAAALAPPGVENAETAEGAAAREGEAEHLLVALTCRHAQEGRAILRDLLRALRLFGDGRVALGALAWARAGGQDAWSAVALGGGGRPHGMLIVTAEQEDELRAFCNLVSRRSPHANELAWALRRFELGCERDHTYEGLSDHLLALRALLEPEGPASGLLAGRIAALCATPERRVELTERMLAAQRLERAIVAGAAPQRAGALTLAREVADHLRALLRDVICGHLASDLVTLADTLLAQAQDVPGEESAEEAVGDAREAREVVDVLV